MGIENGGHPVRSDFEGFEYVEAQRRVDEMLDAAVASPRETEAESQASQPAETQPDGS